MQRTDTTGSSKESLTPHSPHSSRRSPMVVVQPGIHLAPWRATVLLPPGQPIPGVPFGLEHLAALDEIVVNQLVGMMEFFTGMECRNRYSLCNSAGQQVYFADEESTADSKNRSFSMFITDNTKKIAHIVQNTACCRHQYGVYNNSNKLMFYIKGPVCTCCCGDEEYTIHLEKDNAKIGSITKEWGGMAKEVSTHVNTFVINFPKELDVHWKAVFLGATFLIDFMAYEDNAGHLAMPRSYDYL